MSMRRPWAACIGVSLGIFGISGCGDDPSSEGISVPMDGADTNEIERDGSNVDDGGTAEEDSTGVESDDGRIGGDGAADSDRDDGEQGNDGDCDLDASSDALPDVDDDVMVDALADRSVDAPIDAPRDAADRVIDDRVDASVDAPRDVPTEPVCTLLVHGSDPHPTAVCPSEQTFEPLASRNDWRVQDYPENLGIVAVADRRADGIPGLVVSLRLGDNSLPPENRQRKGEILLDLSYVPGMDGRTPVDMTGLSLQATVQVPEALAADGRNGVQLFVKDDGYRSQYGKWQNLASCGSLTVSLLPGPHAADRHAYTESGFTPNSIRIVGFKVGLGDASATSYVGPLQLVDLKIDPPVPLLDEPPLPVVSPRPPLIGRHIESRDGHILVDGVPAFIVGGNWRAIDYGQNFGATKWFPLGNGVSKHPGYARCELDRFRRAGVQWLRVGLADDGRAVFDAESKPLPSLDAFHADVTKFLDLCREAGIGVEFTLVDFLLAAPAVEIDGVVVQGRRALLEDAATLDGMISTFLTPFLDRYGSHPAFLAFDCMNEPEWLISKTEGGGWDDVMSGPSKATSPVSLTAIQSFFTSCSRAVADRLPTGLVTLGVSGKMAGLQANLSLGYSAIHHYPWMGLLGDLVAGFPQGLPWILEEYPSRDGGPQIDAYLDSANALGAGGALIWNLTPNLDEQTMQFAQRNDVLSALSTWQPLRDASPVHSTSVNRRSQP